MPRHPVRVGRSRWLFPGAAWCILASVCTGPLALAASDSSEVTAVIVGLPSVIEYPSSFKGFLFHLPPLCIRFLLRRIDRTSQDLQITSSGLGGARLMQMKDSTAVGDCTASAVSGTPSLTLSANTAGAEWPLALILPASAFPSAATGATGKIVVLQASKPVAQLPVVLRREANAPQVQGALWFIGILIPAALTAGLSLVVYRLQKSWDAKTTESATFEQFKREKDPDVKAFLTGVYKNAVPLSDEEYRSTLEEEFAELRIVYAFPPQSRERLLAALAKADRKGVASELVKAFPAYKKFIKDPLK
jgi:hypothetical protein